MMGQDGYTVEMPAAAWRRLRKPPRALAAHFHSELRRMAAEFTAHPGRGCGVRTLRARGRYVALVSVDHTMRRLTLAQVAARRRSSLVGSG